MGEESAEDLDRAEVDDLATEAERVSREALAAPDYPMSFGSFNGPIFGRESEDCPGAAWTGEYLHKYNSHLHGEFMVRCAVLRGDEYGPKPYAWSGYRWSIVSDYTAQDVLAAWGVAMLARAERAEWLIAEQTKRRAEPAGG